ncbi:MAG: hypothetical protein LQ352_006370 [Teloschistes flavicans]|nr:MAG: hypothetical protein LQ352_006370 [Teloschistes flavicans]
MRFNTKSSLALVAATLAASASAHSWIEEASVIASNGTMVGQPGYPRAFAKRAAGVDPDAAMVHLLPPNGRPEGNKILDSDPICMPSQQQPKQSDGSPALTAAAGDMVMLRYQENGHVTLPQNQPGKPSNRGTIYIYGTTQPSPDDKFLAIHKVWNADGTGGDKRGKLLATESFDDGQCYQINGGQISTQRQAQFKHKADTVMGQDLWCQNNLKIPKDAPSGKPYTVYWVWDWDTAKGTPGVPDGKLEKYTTCMDINISQGQGSQSHTTNTGAVKFADGQDLNLAAIPQYVNQLATSDTIFLPGTANREAGGSPPAAAPPSSPAAPAAPAPPVSQSSVPAAAGQMTVTVTAPVPARTVTVTAPAQPANTQTTMQTQVKPSPAPAQSSMASAAQPATVSGVVIPTTSMASRFTGTASAVSTAAVNTGSATDSGYQDPSKPAPQASAASAPAPAETGSATDSGYQNADKHCDSCKSSKRSVIFNGSAQKSSHIASHTQGRSLANTKLRNLGSAKFRAI